MAQTGRPQKTIQYGTDRKTTEGNTIWHRQEDHRRQYNMAQTGRPQKTIQYGTDRKTTEGNTIQYDTCALHGGKLKQE